MKVVTKEYFTKDYLTKYKQNFISLEIEKKVARILDSVRKNGDKAVIQLEAKFDHVKLAKTDLAVKSQEFERAKKFVPKTFLSVLKIMVKNVKRYQKDLLQKDWIKTYGSVRLGSLVRPLERVGVYIPGGTAPLVSTVIMTVIPAKVAGVKQVIVATPPGRDGSINPYILAACQLTGVDQVFKVGGAQAIGALAFGTETIPKVDKIVGPGNIYVASAKRQVYGFVGIDMVAGPSEVLIIADDSADPKCVAADLLAQAEHDVMARTFLITTSQSLIKRVQKEINTQISNLGRSSTARESIEKNGYIVLVKNLNEAVEVANEVAPEHVEIICKNPLKLVKKIRNAGAIFVGDCTPEPVGDYVAGPSHVLPTGGTARFFSPLSSREFLKSMSYLQYDRRSLAKELRVIQDVANIEGLDAHRRSAETRFS